MKYFIFSLSVCMSMSLCAQDEDITFLNSASNTQAADGNIISNTGGNRSGRTFQTALGVVGNKFLFNHWDLTARVFTEGDKILDVKNANFDMERGTFSFKEGDNVFDINQFVVSSVTIGDMLFKRTKNPSTNISRLMEVVYESDDLALLKDHNVRLVEGKFNIQEGQMPDELKPQESYYLISDGEFKKFKPKKSAIIKVFGSHEKEMVDFVKNNNLSYKDDLKTIFSELGKLRSIDN